MWPRQSEIKTWSLCPWKKRSVPSIGSSYQNCLSSDKPKKLRYSVIENISSSRKMMKHLWVAVFIQVGDNGPCSHPSHHKIVNTTGYWKWGVSIERVTPRFRGSFSPSAHAFSYQVSLCFHSFHKEQPKRERNSQGACFVSEHRIFPNCCLGSLQCDLSHNDWVITQFHCH